MKISFLGTVMISLGLPRCLLTTSFMLYEIIPRGYPLRDKCFLRSSPGGGGYSPKKWVGVCGPLPKTLTLFMSSLQANLRPKSAIFPTLFMSY